MQDLIRHTDSNSVPWSVDQVRGQILRKELRFLCKDGTFLEVEVSMSGLEDGRIQAIIRDVAERKRLEMHAAPVAEAGSRGPAGRRCGA